jgi:hypothetical protein
MNRQRRILPIMLIPGKYEARVNIRIIHKSGRMIKVASTGLGKFFESALGSFG